MLYKCKMILMEGNILQSETKIHPNRTATLFCKNNMSSYFLSIELRMWIRHVGASLVVCGGFTAPPPPHTHTHGATHTDSLTEFGFLGFERRSGQETKTEEPPGNND